MQLQQQFQFCFSVQGCASPGVKCTGHYTAARLQPTRRPISVCVEAVRLLTSSLWMASNTHCFTSQIVASQEENSTLLCVICDKYGLIPRHSEGSMLERVGRKGKCSKDFPIVPLCSNHKLESNPGSSSQ